MMHHLNRAGTSIQEGLDRAAYKLRQEKRDFLMVHRDELAACYESYDKRGTDGNLNQLMPLWQESPTDSVDEKNDKALNRALAEGLYGSSRPIINKHWEELKNRNGGSTLICPICGIKECEDMDHYVPRSLMPEYSVHLSNLIPLCHRCNINKGDKWLDDTGQRQIYNAYFDQVPERFPITISIIKDELVGLPQLFLQYNAATATDAPVYRLIDGTVERLKLMEVYRQVAKTTFRKELTRISVRLGRFTTTQGKQEEWGMIKEEYRKMIQLSDTYNFIDVGLFESVINSPIIDDWVGEL